jgi:hypothetical protein
MVVVGGTRVRIVYDSIYNEINRALTALGWFDAGREHLPITFRTLPVDDETGVPPNTLVLVSEDEFFNESELGSPYGEHTRQYYLDFYAESQPLGEHVIFDCRDILEGRMASIGRDGPVIPLMNYSIATPVEIGTLDVEFVQVDRGHLFQYPWQKFWYSCSFTILDYYGNETL